MITSNTNLSNTNYSRKFNYEGPKKQAKSYEIDLGQNVSIKLTLGNFSFVIKYFLDKKYFYINLEWTL